jgi:hypothetical protein
MNNEYIVFHIIGTPEKDIVATSVVNSLKETKKDKKIIVVTNFPEIWLHNPDIYRVYKHGYNPYFYDDFIKDKKTKIYAHDPYLTDDFLYEKKPLVEIWCEMIGIEHNGSKPKLHFTQREKEVSQRLLTTPDKLLLIQEGEQNNPIKPVKQLPTPILQQVINYAKTKGYNVVQASNNQKLAGVINLQLNLRLSLAGIKQFDKCLFINSFLQYVRPDATVLNGNERADEIIKLLDL